MCMKKFLQKVWRGLKLSIKWLAIQYAIILLFHVIVFGAMLLWAKVSGCNLRDVIGPEYYRTPRPGFEIVVSQVMPIYTFLLAMLHAFVGDRKKWLVKLKPTNNRD